MKKSKPHYNTCPECGDIGDGPTMAAEFDFIPPDRATVGLCRVCGSLIMVAMMANRKGVIMGKLDHDWFFTNFDEQDREKLHEAQEKRHHELGHFG